MDVLVDFKSTSILTPLIDDIFNRPDASTLGDATYQGTWFVRAGFGFIEEKQGGITGNGTGSDCTAVVDTGRSNVHIKTKITFGTVAPTWQPVIFRRVDIDNYWAVSLSASGAYVLQAFNAGTVSSRGASSSLATPGDVLTVDAIGQSVRVYINGVLEIEDTVAAWHETATQHGIGHRSLGTSDAGTRRWMHFRCEPR